MKEKRYGTYEGLTVPVQIFESYQEADTEAGRVNAMLDCGNDNAVYRGGPLNQTRDFIIALLEQETGITQHTKDTGKKDKDGNPIFETTEKDGDFIARVMAEKGLEDLKQFQPQVDAWAATADEGSPLAISLKQRERKAPQPKTIAKEFVETAKTILGRGADFVQKWYDAKVKPFGLAMPTLSGDVESDSKVLGKLVKDVIDAKKKAELAELSA